MTLVYHYTSVSQHLPLILDSGELRPSNTGGRESEPPLLWFSRNRSWEATAGKAVMHRGKIKLLNMRQQHESYGCARFGIAEDDPRLMEWRDACQYAGIGRDERRAMERNGKKRGGDSTDWVAVSSTVPILMLTCETFNGITWEPLSCAN
ncbi:hypothetical protein I6U33_05460 [Pseudomonas carnis]|mgnify:CR=1 FL=1|uniref:hypothetical protein n=1 Tax=Pseudomonas TaxID=286 RepID=UPI0018E8DD47|nr:MULTISPECIES: hypothetical protein [Pseudomonas]MBJ2225730.1 hypothetical protein [Pseudomonas sp. MF7451]MBW9236769.1 hypothetical protein [Pseudomonas carnis]